MKKILAIGLCLLAAITLFACLPGEKEETKQTYNNIDISNHVELTMYLIGTKPDDMDKVLDELNKKIEQDLNASLTIKWIGWGEFSKEYPILLSSGQSVDLIYAANWLDFYENAERGAFLELEELLETYAPESYSNMSDSEIKDVSINNHIYAVPADYTNFNAFGPMIRKDYLDKYNVSNIESFKDYMNLCTDIGKNENIDPTGLCSSSIELDDLYLLSKGYYPLTGSTGSMYWIDLNDENKTVYYESECPDFKYFIDNAKTWYEDGCWGSDVLSSKDETMLESLKAASRVHNYDAWLGESGKDNNLELEYFNLVSPLYKQSASQDCMAIPKSSKNPERALMLLEKLKNDEDYYMLLTYGIEGYNYKLVDDNRIEFLNDTYGNEPGTWGMRNEKFYKLNSAVSDEAYERRQEYVESAEDNPMAGFYMDLSEIEKEYEQIDYISKLYFEPLILGYVDKDEGLNMLNSNLETEGNDKVKKELQKQVDEYFDK